MRRMICSILCVIMLSVFLTACSETGRDHGTGTADPINTGSGGMEQKSEYLKHLEEKYADYTEVPYGLDITKKTDIVSICYSTWFTKILGPGRGEPKAPPNITEILAGNGEWGGVPAFHYWGKPAVGYYRSDDKEVIRTHMTQLAEAGVDFIIIDNTNASVGWKPSGDWRLFITLPCTAILDTIVEMRAEGKQTPYVVFWSSVNTEKGWGDMEETYEQFYTEEKWKDCFVYWEGKPFAIATDIVDNPPETFTIRKMWGLRSSPEKEEWSFLNVENVPTYDQDGFVEQTCVCCACQETYMSAPTAHGRNHGIFFYEQWKRAFDFRPKVITLTWWNEWAAQRFYIESGPYAGQYHFTDNYNMDYSRDIEPVEGGHGDQYYQWMKEYIRAYRTGENCPRLVEAGY